MNDTRQCEYCTRPIKDGPIIKVIRGKKHIFCSEFCYRLQFYNVPTITYENLQKMYAFYCVSIPAEEYRQTLQSLMGEEA